MSKKTATPDVVDASDNSADQSNDEALQLQQTYDAAKVPAHNMADHTSTTGEGVRVTRAFAMKQFIPTPDWIRENIIAKKPGYHEIVGRIFGTVYKAERRFNVWQDKKIEGVTLSGVMQAQTKDGEIFSVTLVFLPLAFAEQVEMALKIEGNESVQMDVDIGLEATGKTIPYQWTVTSYIEGRAERALRQMRGSRQIGQAPNAQLRLATDTAQRSIA